MLNQLWLCAAVLLLSACSRSMYQYHYSGPRRPASEVAFIQSEDSAIISEIDGVETHFPGSGGRYWLEVLPGEHAIGVMLLTSEAIGLTMSRTIYSNEPYTLCMKAEAGKAYVIRNERVGLLWRPQVFDQSALLIQSAQNATESTVIATDCRDRRVARKNRGAGLYETICEEGNAQGCFTLGEFYKDGREVPQDERRAATLFEKACNGGVALGCNSLGVLYKDGRGVPQDERRAATLFEKACTGGVAQSCFNLGLQYVQGRGVSQDERRAATLFETACTGEVAQGCFNLGVLYKEGRGVSRDERRATALFETACQGGMSAACSP